MKGMSSQGMLLCASNESHDKVELLQPPADAVPGERIRFGEYAVDEEGNPLPIREPESPNRVQKKKIWEAVQKHLQTDDDCIAGFKDMKMITSKGNVRAMTLSRASIS